MNLSKRLFHAYLDDRKTITVLIPKTLRKGQSSRFFLKKREFESPLMIGNVDDLVDQIKYTCIAHEEIEFGETYDVITEFGDRTDLQVGAVVRTNFFDELFFYDGKLGVTYDKDKTNFKLWAPTATAVKLNLFNPTDRYKETFIMKRGEKGVWTKTVHKDVERYEYTYSVCVNLHWREAVDPYAVAVTANGKRGIIVDLRKTKINTYKIPPIKNQTDAIIYETHLRDFTIHPNSGVAKKGTYLGTAERNTKGKSGNLTGLSYVKDLGVTHVEFLPFHDFAGVNELGDKSDYNWGYNPLHFNAPDGSYATDPEDPYARIIELKTMIQTFHQEGIGIIMDVVYNHVYILEESSFNLIVPGYYFRHDAFGNPSNGTGVGNDIASERKMVRKFIVDSCIYWKKEYDVDGFRFDLMGILDVETMNMIREKLSQIDPSTIIIGEGWDLNTPLSPAKKANIKNESKLPNIGHFNDQFRDAVKGSTFNLLDRGYVVGNTYYYETVKEGIAGSVGIVTRKGLFSEPAHSVNYVESHDNHTMWDKLKACIGNEQDEILKKRQQLATSIVLLSQGIPFLHSGQEFFRTKKGIGNSFRHPNEINQLDWDLCDENRAFVQYIKGIIAIRKSHGAFRFATKKEIQTHVTFLQIPSPVIGYFLKGVGKYGKWNEIIVLFNPECEEKCITLPAGGWKILANHQKASEKPFGIQVDQNVYVKPISTYVLVKE